MAPKQNGNQQTNSTASAHEEIKKPFIKNNTLMGIIVAIGVIVAALIFVMTMLKNKDNDSSSNEADTEWYKIADYITDMIENGDLAIKYFNSDQRKTLSIATSELYYLVQHNGTNLYFGQNYYSTASTTDEMKISEAEKGRENKIFSSFVTDFSVENYNQGTNSFSDGTVQIRMRVEKDGKIKQDTFTANLPVKQ